MYTDKTSGSLHRDMPHAANYLRRVKKIEGYMCVRILRQKKMINLGGFIIEIIITILVKLLYYSIMNMCQFFYLCASCLHNSFSIREIFIS